MKKAKIVVIIGSIILGFGILFHLQGRAVVGPTSSFMYSNPQWIDYGVQIILAGVIIVGIGIGILFSKRIK